MRIAKTEYFDIIFSYESLETATLIYDKVDGLFEKACEEVHTEKKFRMPLVISPDSDVLKVKYSPSPYNRIILFEGVPDKELSNYENTVLGLLYHEIFRAVSLSVRSKFSEFIKKFVGTDSFQPIPLLSLPFSFADAFTFVEESKDSSYGQFNDGYFLQLLSQAKLEGNFPRWTQISVKRTVYPGPDYCYAAAAAFTAYIQQRWGMEKFYEFWAECSKLHLIRFTEGIFREVYGERLAVVWKDFKDSIPLPEDLEQMEYLEPYTKEVFINDTEGLYKDVVETAYGLVWYDDMRHEVDIFDTDSPVKIRKLLFLANEVNRLAVSPDGRFLALSYTQNSTREQFKHEVVWIYDLKTRGFFSDSFDLRDGSIIQLSDGSYGIAGVDIKSKNGIFKVYRAACINNLLAREEASGSFAAQETELVYERKFEPGIVVASPVFAGKGKTACLVNQKGDWSLLTINLDTQEEQQFQILNAEGEFVNIKELHLFDEEKTKYAFTFVDSSENSFSRMGYITLSKDYELKDVYLQTMDLNGGVNCPVYYDDRLFYVSYKTTHNEFKSIPMGFLDFEKAELNLVENQFIVYQPFEDIVPEFDTKKYKPSSYWFHGAVIPMMPVRELSFTDGASLWPGIGVTYITNSDPLLSTEMVFSGGSGFAQLSFEFFQNPNTQTFQQLFTGASSFDDNWTFSVFAKNTSTPVDISAGTMFRFDPLLGTYEGSVMAVTGWQIPMGMTFRTLKMDIQTRMLVSSEYYDQNQALKYPSMYSWPSFDQAYQNLLLRSTVTYSNIHQYGKSAYEKRGLSVTTYLTGIWDIKASQAYMAKRNQERVLALQQQDVANYYAGSDLLLQVTDFIASLEECCLGVSAELDVPRLTPLTMQKGMVLSVPAVFGLDVYNNAGTALSFYGDFLLWGMEIQQGISPLYLYISRAGIKVGYHGAFEYDRAVTSAPNFVIPGSFDKVFRQSVYNDYISVKMNLDFVPIIGKFTETEFKTSFDFRFYLQKKSFAFLFGFNFEY